MALAPIVKLIKKFYDIIFYENLIFNPKLEKSKIFNTKLHWILLSSNCSKSVNFWAKNMFCFSNRSEFRHKLTEFVIRKLGRRNGCSDVKMLPLELIGAMRWLQVHLPLQENLQLSNASPSLYWAVTNFPSNSFCFVSWNML